MTTLQQVIEAGGFSLNTYEDAQWLISQAQQFEDLLTKAEDLVEKIDEESYQELERQREIELAEEEDFRKKERVY